ncbi:MAG: DNA polymerase II small subunit [Candidatus Heimdallarchaeota archaeon LC_3]|nr:MAG: DNA polymerase II small subunit [Candidatus Heimdallarchaeota archaeon LC_3]
MIKELNDEIMNGSEINLKNNEDIVKIISEFYYKKYLFSPNFIFYNGFLSKAMDFLEYLDSRTDITIIISIKLWLEYLYSKYYKKNKLEPFLKIFFLHFSYELKILMNSSQIVTLLSEFMDKIQKENYFDKSPEDYMSFLISIVKKGLENIPHHSSIPTVTDIDEFDQIDTSYSSVMSPKDTIIIELPSIYPSNSGKVIDFRRYYNNRFQQLSTIIEKRLAKDINNVNFFNFDAYELNKECYFIIFVEQINIVQVNRSNVKTLEQEVQFHGVNPRFQHQLIISISLENLKPFNIDTLPTGIVCGFLGVIESVKKLEYTVIFNISSSKIIFPSTENNLSHDREKNYSDNNSLQTGTDNYALIIGSMNIRSLDDPNYEKLFQWLMDPQIEYRLKYIFFIGGILSFLPFEKDTLSKFREKKIHNYTASEIYNDFFNRLSNLPDSFEFFFLPGYNDFSRKFIPQPPIAPLFCLKKDNMHYLSNPAKIQIEDQKIIFLNPSNHFWLKECPYKENSYKTLFDMLEFRHLYPDWKLTVKPVPDDRDFLVMDSVPDVIITSHPNSTQVPIFRNILVGTISPFNLPENSKLSVDNNGIGILFNLKNSTERVIINLLR